MKMIRWWRTVSLFLFLFVLSFAPQGAAATFTLEQVLSSPFPSNLVAASRAGRVAWVFNAKGSRNLWIADVPSFAARPVTHYSGDDGQPIASLRITPDGRTLVYVRGSETNEAGRVADPTSSVWSRKQQVWAVDVDGDSPRLLGDMGCAEEECEDVELSPDGQFAVWATRKQLWIAPVSGVTAAHQLTDLRGENSAPKWSPGGRQIAFVSDRGGHSFIAFTISAATAFDIFRPAPTVIFRLVGPPTDAVSLSFELLAFRTSCHSSRCELRPGQFGWLMRRQETAKRFGTAEISPMILSPA